MELLRKTLTFACFFLAYLPLGHIVPSFGDMPSAKDALDRSENEYNKIKYLQFRSESVSNSQRKLSNQPITPPYQQKEVSVVKLDIDRNFAYLLSDIIKAPPQDEVSDRAETYFLDGTGFTLRANSSSNEVFTLWTKKDAIHGDTQNAGWRSVFFESEQLLPMGIFRFEGKTESIFDLMRRLTQLKIENKKNEGNESYVISGENDLYRFMITLDPERNSVLSSYSIVALRRGDKTGGLQTFEYKGTDFVNIDGLYFPKTFDLLMEAGNFAQMPSPQKPMYVEYKSTMTASIEELSINKPLSKIDYGFQTKIENGTTVYVEEARQIDHIWLDGKPVVKTDEVMLAIARGGHKFMPGPDNPRFWMMLLSIILILTGGGMWVYKNFIRKEGGA